MSCTTCNGDEMEPQVKIVATKAAAANKTQESGDALGLRSTAKLPMSLRLPVNLARYNGGRRVLIVLSADQRVHTAVREWMRESSRYGDLFVIKKLSASADANTNVVVVEAMADVGSESETPAPEPVVEKVVEKAPEKKKMASKKK